MTTDPSSDVLERLRRKHQVLPEQGSGSITVDPATGETIVNCTITDDGYRLVNPDGPEAAATIERLSAERMQLREALEPFIEAAKIGVATHEAVKAANLRKSGLSSYDTVYISAGVYAAESRMSFADWERLAALSNTAENG